MHTCIKNVRDPRGSETPQNVIPGVAELPESPVKKCAPEKTISWTIQGNVLEPDFYDSLFNWGSISSRRMEQCESKPGLKKKKKLSWDYIFSHSGSLPNISTIYKVLIFCWLSHWAPWPQPSVRWSGVLLIKSAWSRLSNSCLPATLFLSSSCTYFSTLKWHPCMSKGSTGQGMFFKCFFPPDSLTSCANSLNAPWYFEILVKERWYLITWTVCRYCYVLLCFENPKFDSVLRRKWSISLVPSILPPSAPLSWSSSSCFLPIHLPFPPITVPALLSATRRLIPRTPPPRLPSCWFPDWFGHWETEAGDERVEWGWGDISSPFSSWFAARAASLQPSILSNGPCSRNPALPVLHHPVFLSLPL